MLYGDASPYLGTASKKMYCLVRKTLGVPFLCLACILLPEPEQFVGQQSSATAAGVDGWVVYCCWYLTANPPTSQK